MRRRGTLRGLGMEMLSFDPFPPASMAAAPAAEYEFEWGPSSAVAGRPTPSSRLATYFSPPLIAMIAVLGTALLILLYAHIISRLRRRWTRWRRRRRRLALTSAAVSDIESQFPPSSDDFFLSPYGLDDSAIKALPLSLYSKAKAKGYYKECAVCLLEFDEDDSLRTLPACAHAFHAECIDAWLRFHATCPLCRAAIFRPCCSPSPFVPMRAARIRPSLDDLLLEPPDPDPNPDNEIAPAAASPPPEDRISGRDFLLKRSYSFGFERNLATDRMQLEASTASPWRYRQRSFWSKRWPSPFGGGGGSSSASRSVRVFSFRSYRGVGMKSPFMRLRGFHPLSSEPSVLLAGCGAGPSSRRTRSLASPARFWSAATAGFSSSRMRCGDPEALVSPERLNRR